MIQVRSLSLILGGAALLLAADPDWKTTSIADWSDADAHQVLENSPWAKTVLAGIARRQTEDERREGGNMGQPTGVGYDGVQDRKIPIKQALGNPFIPGKPLPSTAPTVQLLVRWESALPVRAAEFKTHEDPPPTLSDDGYTIAVYGVPASFAKGDPTSLFPLSAEISKKDDVVEFSALIGRLQVSQHFLVAAMQFQGKLEL
jgi:hypothetical protein